MSQIKQRHRIDYHRYMASRAWALKKNAIKDRSGNTCERCHDAPHHNTHHLTYERLGTEDLDHDLIGVCRSCHEFLSGERNPDPAIQTVQQLIKTTGLFSTGISWGSHWSTGPTSRGHYFHGDLCTSSEPSPRDWADYLDDTRLTVPIADGIWYHCNSY